MIAYLLRAAMVRLCFGGPTMKYFVTWQCDDCNTGMSFLTVIPSDEEAA